MNINEIYHASKQLMAHREVPLILGAPGIGKSEIINKLGKSCDVIVVCLAQVEAYDIAGIPHVDASGGTFTHIPLSTFPLKGLTPEPKRTTILFLDELTQALPPQQNAAYGLILDRKVGQYTLHDNVYVVCAGNRAEDNSNVVPLSAALINRTCVLEMEVDTPAWLEWANATGVHSAVIQFITQKPDTLMNTEDIATAEASQISTPRSWSKLSNLLNDPETMKLPNPVLLGIIKGFIGTKLADGFFVFVQKSRKSTIFYPDLYNSDVVFFAKNMVSILALVRSYFKETDDLADMVALECMSDESQATLFRVVHTKFPNYTTTHPPYNLWVAINV